MPDFDPSDPVDAKEIARRLEALGHKAYSHIYIAQQLSKQTGFPAPGGWDINGGRWWQWGDVLEWFTNRGTPTK